MKIQEMIEEVNIEYKKFCGSYAKILSYISKINNSEINEKEKEDFLKIKNKFKNKIEHMNNFLRKEK